MSILFEGKNPRHNPIQEIPVMRHNQNDAGETVQIILQNLQGLNVQIIGRLIQNQNVRILHQNAEQVQSSFLSA